MSRITKQITKFNVGMSPILYDGGIYRMEHFENVDGRLVPFRKLTASTLASSTDRLVKIVRGSGPVSTSNVLFGLARETATGYGRFMYWQKDNFQWFPIEDLANTGAYAEVLHFYNGDLYGLWNKDNANKYLWKFDLTVEWNGTLYDTFQALSYTTYADFLTHSKDGLMYIPVDNKVYSCNGTTLTLGLTLPVNYIITSIAEEGDYISIVGYDSQTNKGVDYLWDRDSSLATLTAKYDLGVITPKHNAYIGGREFIISTRTDSDNSSFTDNVYLEIGFISSSGYEILKEYKYITLAVGGKYIGHNCIYFNARVNFPEDGNSNPHWVIFKLDGNGILTIVQNVDVNDTSGQRGDFPGLIKDGDSFWIGGGIDGAWHTASAYGSTDGFGILETGYFGPELMNKTWDGIGLGFLFNSLSSGSTMVVKLKKDNDTSWTTLVTLATDVLNKNTHILNGIDASGNEYNNNYQRVRLRLEAKGGTIINGVGGTFDEKNDGKFD